jgi:hypothetical protein
MDNQLPVRNLPDGYFIIERIDHRKPENPVLIIENKFKNRTITIFIARPLQQESQNQQGKNNADCSGMIENRIRYFPVERTGMATCQQNAEKRPALVSQHTMNSVRNLSVRTK